MQKSFDGAFSLEQLQNTLNTEQQLGFVLLKNLKKRDEPPPANVGTFDDDPNPAPPKELVLIEVPKCDDSDIIEEQRNSGRELVCCGPVFVAGAEKKVAVFR